uniref:Uncharacterized protein n=2 Tax=Aegilops tauschii subsp. strangulata TaxID=200361 RepID=A0A453N4X5_AEGTS
MRVQVPERLHVLLFFHYFSPNLLSFEGFLWMIYDGSIICFISSFLLCDYHEKNSIPRSQMTRKRNEVNIRCYQYRRNGESVIRDQVKICISSMASSVSFQAGKLAVLTKSFWYDKLAK